MCPSRSQGHTNVVAVPLAVRWHHFKLIAASLMAAVFLLTLASQANAQTTSGNSTTGQSLFSSKGCIGCHTASGATKANAINAGGHIEHARSQGMGAQPNAGQEYNDIAAYLATLFPEPGTQPIAHNTATSITIPNVVLNTAYGDYVGLRTTSGGQARGAASFTVGSTLMTYTPTAGQCGADTVNYEAYRTINSGTSNLRTLSVSIANPAAPNITTSANSANGVIGSVFTYTPVSSGGTVGIYDISSGTLPAGLGLNTSTGAITGTPSGTAGISNVTLRGSNCLNGALSGQSSTRNIAVTINTSASVTLLASPSTVSSGGSATLTWSSDGASCAASGAWSGIKASVGSQVLTNLSVTANYTITCSGASGSASQTVTIIVN